MISYLLFYKILQLFSIMLLGFLLVKLHVLKSKDSLILSKISLYLLMPAVIINSFDVTLSGEISHGLATGFIAAVIIHIVFIAIGALYKKTLHATSTEVASVIYSNAGNLIIPIVSFILGEEWVIYTCAYISVQIVFLWTHGINLFSKNEKLSIKQILTNVNIIAIAIGVIIMLCKINLPSLVKDTVSEMGGMLGNFGMLIAGMLAAEIDFKKILANKRLYTVLFLRMVICPAVILIMLKFLRVYIYNPHIEKVLLISFLASMTPSASTVMQFAQIKNDDSEYAAAINAISTLICIFTMPIFVALY